MLFRESTYSRHFGFPHIFFWIMKVIMIGLNQDQCFRPRDVIPSHQAYIWTYVSLWMEYLGDKEERGS